jgi:3-dehydroquinate synthase
MYKVKLNLKERSYFIYLEYNILRKLSSFIDTKNRKVVVIADEKANRYFGEKLKSHIKGAKLQWINIKSGEANKTIETAFSIFQKFLRWEIHRDALVIAFGGGKVGDLAGFVAATYMRGVDYVQIPTTLLAQVDAAIGGKTAVNLKNVKNIVGAFYQPKAVIIDPSFLETLPEREFRTGIAEVIKYGIIKNKALFSLLERRRGFSKKDIEKIILESAKIKALVVARDEREETGLRMILNFGHTLGHVFETLGRLKNVTHGEAISLGMVAASYIAERLGLLTAVETSKIKSLIESFSLPASVGDLPKSCRIHACSASKILKILYLDKKVRKGSLIFVLPKKIGKVIIRSDVNKTHIKEALKRLGCP